MTYVIAGGICVGLGGVLLPFAGEAGGLVRTTLYACALGLYAVALVLFAVGVRRLRRHPSRPGSQVAPPA